MGFKIRMVREKGRSARARLYRVRQLWSHCVIVCFAKLVKCSVNNVGALRSAKPTFRDVSVGHIPIVAGLEEYSHEVINSKVRRRDNKNATGRKLLRSCCLRVTQLY